MPDGNNGLEAVIPQFCQKHRVGGEVRAGPGLDYLLT